jgi:integrase
VATIRKRKNKAGVFVYDVQVRTEGYKPVNKGGWSTLREAKRWAAQTETEIREGRYFNKAATKHTVAEAIDEFVESVSGSNQSKYLRERCKNLKYWHKVIGHYLLEDIDAHTIEKFQKELSATVSARTKRALSSSTVLLYIVSLSLVFNYICRVHDKIKWITYNPLKNVIKPKAAEGRTRYLKSTQEGDNELQRLIAATKEVVEFRKRNKTLKKSPGSLYLYYILQLALHTGMRSGEIKNLKWDNVYLNQNILRLYKTKNGKNYTVILTDQAVDLLREHFNARRLDTEYVFPSRDGKSPVDWRRPFEEAVLFANIPDFNFHDLRHTFASYLTMGGESSAGVQAALRHESRQATERYQHLSPQYTRAGVQAMANSRLGADPKQVEEC